MTPSTITTILNTAPMILQGAGKLIKMIRERKDEEPPLDDIPMTIEGLKQEIQRIESRLNDADEASVEQVRLIEQLARQNEALATSLERILRRSNMIFGIAAAGLLLAIGAIFLSLL